jgi:hypothetical protein
MVELSGASYLYTIASLALAFVAFSTIVVVLRQMLGAEMSVFQILLVKLFIENGMSITAFALLPPLLGFFNFSGAMIWRVSSAAAAIYQIGYLLFYIRRRRRLLRASLPIRIYVNYFITFITITGLWLNVLGKPFEPNIAPYVLALTWGLVMPGIIFIQTLDVFFEKPPAPSP